MVTPSIKSTPSKNAQVRALFPAARACRTHAAAQRKLDRACGLLDGVLAMVVELDDGFLPVAVVNRHTEHRAGAISVSGVCVTNGMALGAP
ncbi:MAG TPA: hypothetical protein VNM34_14880 [Verrucomicrobiae bacterium]|nr:hypothetical protein [Verrucomicrobiae bacterium]